MDLLGFITLFISFGIFTRFGCLSERALGILQISVDRSQAVVNPSAREIMPMLTGILPVSMFWTGRALSVIEQASILSVMRLGHSVTLFGYQKPVGVPDGVGFENASEILPKNKFVFYRGTNPSLGTNAFRYRVQKAGLGLWLDTDVLLLRPIEGNGSDIYGWQDQYTINSAILLLDQKGDVLKDLLEFTSTEYPIPPFFSFRHRVMLRTRKLMLKPKHISDMPWGTWGPSALTYFVKANRAESLARRTEVFYPISVRDRLTLFSSQCRIEESLGEATIAVHMWNARLKNSSDLTSATSGQPVRIEVGSFFEKFCRRELGMKITN